MSALRDLPDFPHAEREPAECSVGPRVVVVRVGRSARAGDEVQAARLVGAFFAESASGAEVAGIQQPNPGERDVLASGDSADDGAEHFGQCSVLGH